MKRLSFFLYGVFNHLLFFAVFGYMAGFVGNFLVPKSIDSNPGSGTGASAVGMDLFLLALFALQHSVMARPWFKHYWTKIVPQPIERSTYVLFSNIVCIILFWQWQSLNTVVWNVDGAVARNILWAFFAAGWLMVPTVSLMINHFDLFGTRQVWLYFRGQPYTELPFRTPLLYSKIRHPLYVGWALAFWATPTMTVGHLLFAGTMTVYMALAALVEERDLLNHFGHAYRSYRERVPMFFPRLCKSEKLAEVRVSGRLEKQNANTSKVNRYALETGRTDAFALII